MSARSLNRATLIGNIGKDPELRKTPQGISVCTIRLATTESYKNKRNEWQEVTDWHSIVLWDRLAEIASQLLKKSDRIFVEGKIRTRTFEKEGQKKHFTEIIAQNMIILDRKSKDGIAISDEVFNDAFESEFLDSAFLTSDDVFDSGISGEDK